MFSTTHSNRVARFGSGATILRSSTPLDDQQIKSAAPSVFAGDKHSSRSDKYTYIPTSEVLAGLRKEGFAPVEVRQGGSRDHEKRGFTKHMLRLRHRTQIEHGLVAGEYMRELVLLNSHDGTSSYQLMSGVFRIVCSNGLIVADGHSQVVRIPHKGDIIGDVINGAFRIIDEGAMIDASISDMRKMQLKAAEQEAFAKAALQLRYNDKDEDGEIKEAPVDAAAVNRARRADDNGSDMWRTFNRVQENLTKGGVSYVHRNVRGQRSRRDTRPVNSIDGNVTLNRALWTLATEMQRIKEAA